MAFCLSSGERRPSSSLAPRQITRNSDAVVCVVIGSFETCGFYFVQFNDERNGVIRTLVSAAVFTLNKAWLDPLKPTERKRRAVVASTVLNFFFALVVFSPLLTCLALVHLLQRSRPTTAKVDRGFEAAIPCKRVLTGARARSSIRL